MSTGAVLYNLSARGVVPLHELCRLCDIESRRCYDVLNVLRGVPNEHCSVVQKHASARGAAGAAARANGGASVVFGDGTRTLPDAPVSSFSELLGDVRVRLDRAERLCTRTMLLASVCESQSVPAPAEVAALLNDA
eukprot:TRINITY_DN16770_c0_g1_i2.p2 TRINITY_DN16770_c0_g1~~TRINITY_DN16770_c0_g1_i2.p2  ORF type:complete len:136 (-),score=31.18 TRINITY_DN16770_c0_g1_i2:116-523(-)